MPFIDINVIKGSVHSRGGTRAGRARIGGRNHRNPKRGMGGQATAYRNPLARHGPFA